MQMKKEEEERKDASIVRVRVKTPFVRASFLMR